MKTLLFSLVISFIELSLIAQGSTELKLNLEKNKVYRFKSASEQTVSQTMSGVQQNTSTNSRSVTSIRMLDASPEFIVAEVRFDTIITKTNAMGVNYTINSATEGNLKSENMGEALSCIMNRLSKNALYVKLNYAGKIVEIVNSKMLSDIILKDTSLITGQLAPTIKTQIKSLADEKSLGTMVESLTYFLPGKQVSSGERWNISETINSGGMSLDITTDYTLGEIKGNDAGIVSEANISASENASPMVSGGASITYGDLKGLSKSDIIVDIQTGLLKESESKTHITGTLDVSVSGMNIQIPMEINSISEVTALP